MSINSVIYKNLYCNKDNLIIPVDSETWFNWLLINKSFNYQYESLNCHFSKDKKGYWTAVKTIKGKRRAKRCGIYRDLTVENMLNIVYELNLTQSDYDLLRQNKSQNSIKTSKTYLKSKIECQCQEITELKNQIKELRSRLNSQQNSYIEYITINDKMIPVYTS